jgi:hypothetical protein
MTQVVGSPREKVVRDWAVPDPGYPLKDRAALVALIVVPALLVALVLAVLTGWWWLAAVLLAAWGLKTFADARLKDPVMLRRLRARPLGPEEGARLRNISIGLAGDLGVPPPELFVMPEGGPNAWVRGGGAGGVLAVTASLLDAFTRTELEAVVAHCLTRIHAPDFVYSNLGARWSDLGAGLAPRIGAPHDARAVALTRYPPGLAAALGKADGRIALYAPLWFVADAPSHQSVSERIAEVTDL